MYKGNIDDTKCTKEILMILDVQRKYWWYYMHKENIDDIRSTKEILMILYLQMKYWWC